MSDTQKIATAQIVAGQNRYNDFMALMNNYDTAVNSTTTALNSQGSASRRILYICKQPRRSLAH